MELHPTGNAQGNYYFLSLTMGQHLNLVNALPLPIPDIFIDRVHALARQQKQILVSYLETETINQWMTWKITIMIKMMRRTLTPLRSMMMTMTTWMMIMRTKMSPVMMPKYTHLQSEQA